MGRRDDDRPTIDLGPAARKAALEPRATSDSDGLNDAAEAADVAADADVTVAPRSQGADREPASSPRAGRNDRSTGPVDSIHLQPTQQIANRGVETNASRLGTRYSTTSSPIEAMSKPSTNLQIHSSNGG